MKKVLVLTVKLAFNTQLVFICSKSGKETLEQVVKHVQKFSCWTDFTCCSDGSTVDFKQVNTAWVNWIVERNYFKVERK